MLTFFFYVWSLRWFLFILYRLGLVLLPSVVLLYLAFPLTHILYISSASPQFHLMMRLTEMMNDLRTCVVNYIHNRILRHTGNHISSHADAVSMRTLGERDGDKPYQDRNQRP